MSANPSKTSSVELFEKLDDLILMLKANQCMSCHASVQTCKLLDRDIKSCAGCVSDFCNNLICSQCGIEDKTELLCEGCYENRHR